MSQAPERPMLHTAEGWRCTACGVTCDTFGHLRAHHAHDCGALARAVQNEHPCERCGRNRQTCDYCGHPVSAHTPSGYCYECGDGIVLDTRCYSDEEGAEYFDGWTATEQLIGDAHLVAPVAVAYDRGDRYCPPSIETAELCDDCGRLFAERDQDE